MRRTVKVAMVAAGMWIVLPGVAGAAPQVVHQSFGNCEDARAAGFSDIQAGAPGYSSELDRDQDGTACGEGDTATPVAAPEAAPTSTAAAITPAEAAPPAPSAEVLSAEATAAQPELAYTGSSSWILTAVAAALVLAGYHLLRAGYDRLDWVTGRKYSEVRFTVESDRRRSRSRR